MRPRDSEKATTCVRAEFPTLRAARFPGAITIHDAALGQIVRRDLEIDAVARQNLDAVAAQAAGDVCEDRLTRLEFDGERRTREHLLDRSEEFERGFLRRLFCGTQRCGSWGLAASYGFT